MGLVRGFSNFADDVRSALTTADDQHPLALVRGRRLVVAGVMDLSAGGLKRLLSLNFRELGHSVGPGAHHEGVKRVRRARHGLGALRGDGPLASPVRGDALHHLHVEADVLLEVVEVDVLAQVSVVLGPVPVVARLAQRRQVREGHGLVAHSEHGVVVHNRVRARGAEVVKHPAQVVLHLKTRRLQTFVNQVLHGSDAGASSADHAHLLAHGTSGSDKLVHW
mmetsp:Transcript_25696/g.48741  ORF Transcript_25696/g.48741 Transcript_25696/m.48741 type:complete len:222 (+) Transcript_25696:1480-2145(+)